MIQTLADLQPIILFGLLITFYSIENLIPYLAKPANKKQHDIHNFILTIISIVVNGLVGIAVISTVTYTSDHQLGLFNQIFLPAPIEILGSILLLDFGSYLNHHLLHRVPFLWRIHRVHHSDPGLNTSSSLRFHPLEVIYSQGIYVCIAIVVFGVSMTSFILYSTLGLVFVIIQHANLKFPNWIERYGRYIFSTPGWHKIHHSNEQYLTDSHYGDIFTFWDRIFGTWHKKTPEEIKYGLTEFDGVKSQRVGYLLRSPFMDMASPGNSD